MKTIYCDNNFAIALSKNSVFHTKYHFIRELINNGEIILQHYRSQEKFTDIFTKPLKKYIFFHLKYCLGVVKFSGFGYEGSVGKLLPTPVLNN